MFKKLVSLCTDKIFNKIISSIILLTLIMSILIAFNDNKTLAQDSYPMVFDSSILNSELSFVVDSRDANSSQFRDFIIRNDSASTQEYNPIISKQENTNTGTNFSWQLPASVVVPAKSSVIFNITLNAKLKPLTPAKEFKQSLTLFNKYQQEQTLEIPISISLVP